MILTYYIRFHQFYQGTTSSCYRKNAPDQVHFVLSGEVLNSKSMSKAIDLLYKLWYNVFVNTFTKKKQRTIIKDDTRMKKEHGAVKKLPYEMVKVTLR